MFTVDRVDSITRTAEIRRCVDGKQARIPVDAATALWMRESERVSGRFAVLSFLTAGNLPPHTFVCVTEGALPWPAWHPDAAPETRPLSLQTWESLLTPGDTDTRDRLLKHADREARIRESTITSELENRCDRIVKEGKDEGYGDSLDHYTALRVKAAFLKMNERVLTDRLAEVKKTIADLLPRIREAAPELAAGWTCPDVTPIQTEDAVADPNTLRVPQVSDYDLTP
jgi:hypothetical protein